MKVDLDKEPSRTYFGRVLYFIVHTNPLLLLNSSASLDKAKQTIDAYKQQPWDCNSKESKEILRLNTLVKASFHPETGERILLPFRMASFVPTNVPILALMLLPNPSIYTVIASQWLNQSVNVAFNYFNANKSTRMTFHETASAYLASVSCSIGIVLGLNSRLAKVSSSWRPMLSRLVPFVAVASAGTVNVYMMRRKEVTDGIDVMDHDGQVLGKSKVAGMDAIKQVAISRIVTSAPALFIPGLIMSMLEKSFLKKRPSLSIPINLSVISASLMLALPFAIALFPQQASLPTSSVEVEFQDMKRKDGTRIERVFFNKGL